jgi:ADP-ribosyl-[dinitrogen reductase] hydrolase
VQLTAAQMDRAQGVLLGTAVGDALGAGYEFGPPLSDSTPVGMIGGGTFDWEPGEWTDDTSMAIVIATVATSMADLRSPEAHDEIVSEWIRWSSNAKDVGAQTRRVLSRVHSGVASGAAAKIAAQAFHQHQGRSGGNGSLMRTAPVALAYLDDADGLAEAARSLSSLTHYDPEAGDACVLWTLAIRHAVLTGEIDIRKGLSAIPEDRRDRWYDRINEAVWKQTRDFDHNGWVVEAFQAAYCAVSRTYGLGVKDALEAAVRGGRDTDTVAAIAGGLAGAAYGVRAIPSEWRDEVHGWPGMTADDLATVTLAILGR